MKESQRAANYEWYKEQERFLLSRAFRKRMPKFSNVVHKSFTVVEI